MWNLKKKDANKLILKTEVDSQIQKTNMDTKEGVNQELELACVYIKQVTNKDVLYSTGENNLKNEYIYLSIVLLIFVLSIFFLKGLAKGLFKKKPKT